MNYSDKTNSVRVDFFKILENGTIGKWYTTEAMTWEDYDGSILIYRAFARMLKKHLLVLEKDTKRMRLSGMLAICLEPYHEHSHPTALAVNDIENFI